jgi:2-dehydro-3-deoxyphosphooctonate aldolase (KDO 8-P synthase)
MLGFDNIDALNSRFFLIAGPCIIEDEKTSFTIAEELKKICDNYDVPLVFKASFKKANRTRLDSFTGIGDKTALEIIHNIGKALSIPTITDIHESKDADLAAQYVDALQIPAFLSRQTDLLTAAAKTNKIINIKKAQFASPESMSHAIEKVRANGNDKIWITERGSSFGYSNLIVDFTGFPIMKSFGCPLVLDCTHSLQLPNKSSGITGGKPEFIETLAKAGIAAGADGIFMETHPDPSISKSDGANMIPLDKVGDLIEKLVKLKKAL